MIQFNINIQATSAAHALQIRDELLAAGIQAPSVAIAKPPVMATGYSTEERDLRDAWQNATGKRFRSSAYVEANGGPLAFLRKWKNGELSAEDAAQGAEVGTSDAPEDTGAEVI